MNDLNPVVNFFQQKSQRQLSSLEKDFLVQNFKKEIHQRKSIIFKNGDTNTRHYFIAEGLVRIYVIDQHGREFNVLFAKENQIIGDLTSPLPTQFFLETIDPCVVYSTSNLQIEKLNEMLVSLVNVEGMDILKKSYIFLQRRLVSILTKNAEDNYLEFTEKHPELVQRLPQYHIASYLGVSPEFLSKIIAKTVKNRLV